MDAGAEVFRRIPGEGWLVLAASIPDLGGETADLMEHLLERLDLSRPVAAIAAPDSDSDRLNEFLEAVEEWLGSEAGYLELDTDLEEEGWERSGMLVLTADDPEVWAGAFYPELEARLRSALQGGAVILAAGGAAESLGERAVSRLRSGELVDGLGWLPGSVVVAEAYEARGAALRAWLEADEPRTALGLHPGAILAIGPRGQVERWAGPAPEVVLGRGWRGP